MVHHLLVVVLKYASMALGAPSVVIFGTTMMPVLSVNSWDTLLMVIIYSYVVILVSILIDGIIIITLIYVGRSIVVCYLVS